MRDDTFQLIAYLRMENKTNAILTICIFDYFNIFNELYLSIFFYADC